MRWFHAGDFQTFGKERPKFIRIGKRHGLFQGIAWMHADQRDASGLEPLPYHLSVVEYLKLNEPDIWAWTRSQKIRAQHVEEVHAELLRHSYRLEADAHPDAHTSLRLAMERLGIDAPATIYQLGGSVMNAALRFVPGEVHILLHGPVLERLSPQELLALFGHELAHYLLWSCEDGIFYTADRILNDALADARSAVSHHETARRYFLHTELFADRGAAVAASSSEAAVALLVKVTTGIGHADASAYLRQSAEIDMRDESSSAAMTHPETFIRARALDLWWQQAEDLPGWLDRKLQGPLALQRLDLPGQLRLTELTRGFISHFLSKAALRSDAVINQVRSMFPDWTEQVPPTAIAAFDAAQVDDDVRSYLNALMLDMALVDPDVRDTALLQAARIARAMGSFDALQVNLKRDARMGKLDLDRLNKQLAKAEAV